MPYEIPQKLQYEEKLLFGLTFKQIVYAALLIPLALIIFLKTGFHLYVRSFLSFLLVMLAVSFMFLNLKEHIINIWSWLKFREAWLMDKKMSKFLGIEKVENGNLYVKR